jgi:hypothetical protein
MLRVYGRRRPSFLTGCSGRHSIPRYEGSWSHDPWCQYIPCAILTIKSLRILTLVSCKIRPQMVLAKRRRLVIVTWFVSSNRTHASTCLSALSLHLHANTGILSTFSGSHMIDFMSSLSFHARICTTTSIWMSGPRRAKCVSCSATPYSACQYNDDWISDTWNLTWNLLLPL